MKDYYKILGVETNADMKQIKKAYRSLSMKYHPDHNNTQEGAEKMREINEAYETLGDEDKKRVYDQQNSPPVQQQAQDIHAAARENMMRQFSAFSNNQFFQSVFSGSGNMRVFHNGREVFANGKEVPEVINHNLTINMAQCYHGASLNISFPRWQVINNQKISETTNTTLHISPGIRSGEVITLTGEGNILAPDNKGDVRITIMVHEGEMEFQRVGEDLLMTKEITLKEALTSFHFKINHPSGKAYGISNNVKTTKTIITDNYQKVHTGMGMIRENAKGNMIIKFKVKYPDSLTDEQVDALSTLL